MSILLYGKTKFHGSRLYVIVSHDTPIYPPRRIPSTTYSTIDSILVFSCTVSLLISHKICLLTFDGTGKSSGTVYFIILSFPQIPHSIPISQTVSGSVWPIRLVPFLKCKTSSVCGTMSFHTLYISFTDPHKRSKQWPWSHVHMVTCSNPFKIFRGKRR